MVLSWYCRKCYLDFSLQWFWNFLKFSRMESYAELVFWQCPLIGDDSVSVFVRSQMICPCWQWWVVTDLELSPWYHCTIGITDLWSTIKLWLYWTNPLWSLRGPIFSRLWIDLLKTVCLGYARINLVHIIFYVKN